MRIALIDVDHHSGFPNLAMMKLSAWHKANGDEVEWYNIFDHYNRTYMAKVFTFTRDFAYEIFNSDEVVRGGTGYDIHSALPAEAEKIFPDYDLYGLPKDTAYGFLSRGCIRKCPWCIVPKKEGTVHPYMDIEEVCHDRPKAILMDNNILASDYGLGQIEKIIKLGKRVDFNQAMDARLVTPEIAKMLAKVKWLNYIRFGCDTAAQVEHCRKAIALVNANGYKGSFMLYTMLHGTIEECYERTKVWRDPIWRGRVCCQSQPMLDLTSQVQHIPQWQKDMARWSNRKAIYFLDDFKDYSPRKGFVCKNYFTKNEKNQNQINGLDQLQGHT